MYIGGINKPNQVIISIVVAALFIRSWACILKVKLATKMVHQHNVEGFEAFVEFMKQFTNGQMVHVYFSGSKLPTGDSWCDDCVRAWPVVDKALILLPPESHFVYVEVGDRQFWKDAHCPFRTDSSTRLIVLPSLLRWKCPQRLEGDQCEKEDLVEMLFTEEE